MAAEPTPRPASPAWQRIWHAIRSPSRGQLVAGLLVAILAFAAVTQVRLTGGNDRYAGMRQSDLVQVLNGLSAASRRAEADLTRLENTRNSLRSRSRRHSTALQQARGQLADLGILAGTVPAVGPGIRVMVNVGPGHSLKVTDLLDGVEELRDAGAEAMQLNGRVRVVGQTSFEMAGGDLRVDGQQVSAPYSLAVIGDPDTLARALSFPGGFEDAVRLDHGRVRVQKLRSVEIAVTRAPAQTTYAQTGGGQ